jgi:hypothetical protein
MERRFSRHPPQAQAASDEQGSHSRSSPPSTPPRGHAQAYADSPDLLRGHLRSGAPRGLQRNLYGELSSHRSREPSGWTSARGRSRSRGRSRGRGRSHSSETDDDVRESRREEEEYQDQMSVRQSLIREQVYQRRGVQQRTEANPPRRDSTTHKALGVLCIYPECTSRVMYTQSFKSHYINKHLKDKEQYTTQHRKDYERAIDDPSLFSNPGHTQKVLSHRLQAQEQRMERMSSNVEGMTRNVEATVDRSVDSAVARSVEAAVARSVRVAMDDAVARMEQVFDRVAHEYSQRLYNSIYDDMDAKLQAMTKYLLAPPPLVSAWAGIKRPQDQEPPRSRSPKIPRRPSVTSVHDELEEKAPASPPQVREEPVSQAVGKDDDEPMAQPDVLMQESNEAAPTMTDVSDDPATAREQLPALKPAAKVASGASGALDEATKEALKAAATPAKPALKVATSGAKAKPRSSPKSKKKSPGTKKIHSDIKERAKEIGRIRSKYQETLTNIERRTFELNRITSKVQSASGVELMEAKKSKSRAGTLLLTAESSKAMVEAELNMYEVIEAAAEGLIKITKQNSKMTKAQKRRAELNKEAKDDASKEAAAAKQRKIAKKLENEAEQLKLEVAAIVDAAAGVMECLEKGSADSDLLGVGMAAREQFKAYMKRTFPSEATDAGQADQVEL